MVIKQQESERKLRRQIAHLNSLIDALTKPLWQYGEENGKRSLESRTIIPIQGGNPSVEKSNRHVNSEDGSLSERDDPSDEDEEGAIGFSVQASSTSTDSHSSEGGFKVYPVTSDKISSPRRIDKELSSSLPPQTQSVSKSETSIFASQAQRSEIPLIPEESEAIPLARASRNRLPPVASGSRHFFQRPGTTTTNFTGISLLSENAPSVDSSIFVEKPHKISDSLISAEGTASNPNDKLVVSGEMKAVILPATPETESDNAFGSMAKHQFLGPLAEEERLSLSLPSKNVLYYSHLSSENVGEKDKKKFEI